MEIEILRRQGNGLRDIAVKTHMGVNAIRKYLASGLLQRTARQPVPGKLAPFKTYLQDRVERQSPTGFRRQCASGKSNNAAAREGYGGCRKEYLQKLRPAARSDPVAGFETEPGHRLRWTGSSFVSQNASPV